MKKISRIASQSTVSLAALVLAGSTAHAQDEDGTSWTDGWFVRSGPRLLLNAKASVTLSKPPASATMYDNGYVLPDVSGGSQTWNWGYSSASQVSGNTLNYSRLDNTAGGTVKDETSDLSVGGEIIIGSELARFEIGGREARLGWEIGYGYNPFSIGYSGIATGTAAYTQASYDTTGVVVPGAPYNGTFNGPGPLLNTTPGSSSTINSASASAFNGSLDSDLHNFKIGVWLDLPVSKKMMAGVSFGYSALYSDAQLNFTENTTFTDLGIPVSGPVSHTLNGRDWNPGVYLEGRFSYLFSKHISAYVNGGYQYNGEFNFSGARRDVSMDFTTLFSVGLGVCYKF